MDDFIYRPDRQPCLDRVETLKLVRRDADTQELERAISLDSGLLY